MRKFLLSLLIVFVLALPGAAQDQGLPGAPDTKIHNFWHTFTGKWMPDIDASLIGAENYKTLQNLRYTDGGLEGVQGYSKINTSVVNATYLKIKNGHQLKEDEPSETHVLAQAYNTGLTASRVYENPTAVPSQGNFTATELHTDASGAGTGRFASGAQGTVFYCNGVESMVYGGDESRVAAFITSTAVIADEITIPKDFTEKVQNKSQDADEVVAIGGGNDSYTKLLMHCDGADASTVFTDSSASAHVPTANADAQMDVDQKVFGTASGLFDGTGDYVSYPDHADWNQGVGLFTIDFWARFDDNAGYDAFFSQRVDDDNIWHFCHYSTNNFYFKVRSAGVDIINEHVSFSEEADRWYHIAIIRGWGGGLNDWAITIDGTAIHTFTDASAVPNYAAAFLVGKLELPVVTYYMGGWIDEFRVSKGIARWTSDFTPDVRAYQDDTLYWVIGSTRPLEGVKFYVSNVNTIASTLTCEEWNGVSWTDLSITDNTTSGGVSLAQTGTVTWTHTEDTSEPKYLNGLYLYFYQFYIDDGQADIYYITADTGFQDVVDIWDGVFRQPIAFQAKRNNKWEDYTLEVNTDTESSDYPFVATLGGIDGSDQIIAMFDDRMTAIRYQMLAGLTNDTDVDQVVEYWDSAGWVIASNLVDLTLDDTGGTDTLNKTGVVSWTPPDEAHEFPQEMFGVYGYAYRVTVDGILETGADYDGTSVDLVTGVPAQIKIDPFKFPSKYNNRTMLCGFTQSNQGNRVDYSLPNAPDVFNGEETSNGGIFSLYFGGEEELSCAAEIENRYGSNLIASFVVFKDTETYLLLGDTPDMEDPNRFRILPVSHNVGCPAPLTLANIEMGYEVAEDAQRQVVIALSYSGPFMFDGSVIVPLKGIENYFDPAESECINFESIDVSRGVYDQTNQEYNLLLPSGAQYTFNNVWLVYDLVRKRWYEKVPTTYPQSLFNVTDTSGAQYVYGGLDTGYMMYIEDGNTWDSTGIAQVVETGDFFPADNSPWWKTRLRRVKIAAQRVTEDVDVAITHYADTATSGTNLTVLELDSGSNRITRGTQNSNILAWSHRFKFSITTSTTAKGVQLMGWGTQYRFEREDLVSGGEGYNFLLAANSDTILQGNDGRIIVIQEDFS